jgi:hypothetical protein
LLPPGLHRPYSGDKLDQVAIELWNEYDKIIQPLKPIDVCIANGDLIDGRENSAECIQGDRQQQADIASICLKHTEAEKYVVVKGTPFHVGRGEKFESSIAEKLNAVSFGAHEFIDVNGLVFDCKHKVGSSGIPHGPYTPIAKERLWGVLWADKGQPKSRVVIRSHTHKFNYCGDFDWLGLTTPGLQGTSEYGVTQVSRTIDFGVVYFDVWSEDKWEWKAKQLGLELIKSEVVKL